MARTVATDRMMRSRTALRLALEDGLLAIILGIGGNYDDELISNREMSKFRQMTSSPGIAVGNCVVIRW